MSAEYSLVINILVIFIDVELGTIRLKSLLNVYMMLDVIDASMDWEVFFDKHANDNISEIVQNVIDFALDSLRCRSRFPGIVLYIEKNLRFICLSNPTDKYRLQKKRSRFALRNWLWAHALYQAPVLQTYQWTTISLPFRVAAHDRNFIRLMGLL